MSGSPKDRGGAIWKWTPKDENKPVEGYGIKRVELKKSAVVVGDIYTPRIVIEDGASLKGSVLVQKYTPRPQTKKEDAARPP